MEVFKNKFGYVVGPTQTKNKANPMTSIAESEVAAKTFPFFNPIKSNVIHLFAQKIFYGGA